MLAAPRPPREGPRARGGGGGSSFVAQRLAQAGLDSDFLTEEPEPSSRHRRGGYADADDIEAPSSDVYGLHGSASRRDSPPKTSSAGPKVPVRSTVRVDCQTA